MKFVHAGDIHLGAEPESRTSLGKLRKEEIWDAFRRLVEFCEQEGVDLLLLPGDLFHGQPLLCEVKEVDYLFRSLTKTKVVMIAGNHDCLLPSSHYYDVNFPDHVTFLMDTCADSVYFPELNTQVFGASYEKRQIAEARYDNIRIQNPERINILLAHGNVLCNDNSIPIHRGILETAGFDYVALGHVHNRFEIGERMAYSGSLEPLNRGETGAKGYIFGEVEKKAGQPSAIRWRFVPLACREYIVLKLSVTPDTTELSLCSEAYGQMREQGLWNLYLLTLSGTRAREIFWNPEAILTILTKRGANVLEVKDETLPDFDVERLREEQQDTLVGRFIERMDGIESPEIKKLALQYGLQALLARDERT